MTFADLLTVKFYEILRVLKYFVVRRKIGVVHKL